jgi:hypothetical protein
MMTDAEIKEASRLIGEIDRLESIIFDKKTRYAVAAQHQDRYSVGGYYPVAELAPIEVTDLVRTVIEKKKARLNDLRAGC